MPALPPPAPALTLLTGAELYAPEPLGVRSVLVGGGRVLWIGSGEPDAALAQALPGADLEIVDLAGLRLVPGLVDSHAHLAGGGGEAGYASRVPTPPLTHYTRAGVTTSVGLLGTDDTVRSIEELLAVARGLREEGLTTFVWTGGYHYPPRTLTGSVRGDIVHLDLCLGLGELAISDHRSSQVTLDEFLRVAADCHVAGLMTGKAGLLHLHLGDGERGLELVKLALDVSELPPGCFYPTHVNRKRALFDEALELAGEGVPVDVTAFPTVEGEDELSAADAVRGYFDAGLPDELLTVSSDSGGCLPRFDAQLNPVGFDVGDARELLRCAAALCDAGLPLERALGPVTLHPAERLKLGAKGRISVGADADLVSVDEHLSVRDLWARGVRHLAAGQVVRLGRFEAP
jgi:beta-aspartyl-dipeptidase (metallo-type)